MTPATIPDPVRTAARTRPDTPAIITPSETVTYADLNRRAAATAARLRSLGLEGKRLAVYRRPDADHLTLILAAFRAGVVVVPISTRQPAAAVPPLLDRIACRTLVAEPDPAWDGLDLLSPESLRAAHSEPRTPNPTWRVDTPATLVFTSGSMGAPKAVLHARGNHVFSALGSVDFFGLGPGDRWLLNLPLYHVGGLGVLTRCVLAGAAVVLPDAGASIEETVRAHGVTHLSLVATQLLRVLRVLRDGDPAALADTKAILLGGSTIPPGLLAEAYRCGLPVHTSYGLTEMASTVTATPPGASLDALGTSGLVLPHREVRLAADGEILVRGATLFAGYVEGDTVHRPDADGWFPTGDLGAWAEVDGRRMLRVTGRIDHLFISGGENVQPEEIEAALGRIESVRRAVVVPVADAEFGQRPAAFVEAEDWEPEAWRSALADTLARFRIPDAFYPWPKDADAGMKVSRSALGERAERLQSSLSDHER